MVNKDSTMTGNGDLEYFPSWVIIHADPDSSRLLTIQGLSIEVLKYWETGWKWKIKCAATSWPMKEKCVVTAVMSTNPLLESHRDVLANAGTIRRIRWYADSSDARSFILSDLKGEKFSPSSSASFIGCQP